MIITITSIEFESSISSPQAVKLSWRKTSDPDVPASYNTLPDATVATDWSITPSPYGFTTPDVSITVKAITYCPGATAKQTVFLICQMVSGTMTVTPTCEAGYTLSPDQTYCYKELVVDADCSGGSTNTACHFSFSDYSQFGTVFYKAGGYDTDGTYTIAPTNLYTTNLGGVYTGTIWGNDPSNTTDGRLNITGLWLCGDQTYSGTLGFSRQVSISTTKQYYIGFGADNYGTIKVNGTTIVSMDATAVGAQHGTTLAAAFKLWHVYPVVLSAGINIIEMEGVNSGSVGVFGIEIYDATEAQLIACTTASGTNLSTSLAATNLHRYIVFSTKDIVDNSLFDIGNCNCDDYPGYSLLYNSFLGIFECKKIETKTPE